MKVYHNPRCSKSRAALEALQDREVDVILYLNNPPDEGTLREIISRLHQPVEQLVRWKDKDAPAKPANVDADSVVQLILQQPKLMERPIADNGEIAVIGRPTELLTQLL